MAIKLDNLLTQWEALQQTIKPLLDEQVNLKTAIKEELAQIKLDHYAAGGVSVSRYETTRVFYPTDKLVKIVPEDLLKQIRVVTKTEGLRLTVAKKE